MLREPLQSWIEFQHGGNAIVPSLSLGRLGRGHDVFLSEHLAKTLV
jgi:hypothetical protein